METEQMRQKERSCLSKRRYWSQIDALVIASRCMDQRRVLKLETYRCVNCHGWHLARQTEPATPSEPAAAISTTNI